MTPSVSYQVFLCVLSVGLCLVLTVNALPKLRTRVLNDPRIPITSFSCDGRPPGYYADTETGCQVYHMCDDGARQYSYICPNTTLFHQRMLICAHWYQVNCSHSEHDFDANLLIGQQDKPFVDEDFWKHRFGGAGNTNFPPQQLPIRELQSNILHETSHSGKPTSATFAKTPTTQQQSPTQFAQPFTTTQFVQPQPVRSFVSTKQTPEPMRAPQPTQQSSVFTSPPQSGFGQLFDRKPSANLQSSGTAQQLNGFSGNRAAVRPSIDLEVPYFDPLPEKQPNVQKPTNFFAVTIRTPDSDELTGIHDEEEDTPGSPSSAVTSFSRRPSIDLEPPVQNDAIPLRSGLPAFPPSKREDQPTITFVKDQDTGALQANATQDDRFTQVYILPSGKVPPRGPYAHPDLSQNKIIFTDWNSLLQEKPEASFPNNNYNEYVNGKIPGDEEKPVEKEDEDKNPSDDLQREFSSNFPTPANFFAVRIKTGDSDELSGFHDDEEDNPSSPSPVKGRNQPAPDLLPPYDIANQPGPSNPTIIPLGPTSSEMTQVLFGNFPSFGSKLDSRPALNINNLQISGQSSIDSDTSELTPRPALNVNNVQISGQSNLDFDDDSNSTTVIQNPFQHPFYKIRKMNDQQNIIFIPLTDSDFALELRKVPLNRSRVARKVLVRTRPLNGDVKAEDGTTNKQEDKEEEQEALKCGHCNQGYLVDRDSCFPCVPLS